MIMISRVLLLGFLILLAKKLREDVRCTFLQVVKAQNIRVVSKYLEDGTSRATNSLGNLAEACRTRTEVICVRSFVTEYVSELIVGEDLEQIIPSGPLIALEVYQWRWPAGPPRARLGSRSDLHPAGNDSRSKSAVLAKPHDVVGEQPRMSPRSKVSESCDRESG